MIIDFRREMDDNEYEKYTGILNRRIDRKWLNNEFEELNCYWNNVVINKLVCMEEDDYLQGLEANVEKCVKNFIDRGWTGNIAAQYNDAVLWVYRKNISCVIIYYVSNNNNYHILFKNSCDYNEYKAKYYNIFNGGISLLANGWVKQKALSKEKTKWAIEELKDDFLHDRTECVYYFKSEAAMAFKLRWE